MPNTPPPEPKRSGVSRAPGGSSAASSPTGGSAGTATLLVWTAPSHSTTPAKAASGTAMRNGACISAA